jgi:hypothetical protein
MAGRSNRFVLSSSNADLNEIAMERTAMTPDCIGWLLLKPALSNQISGLGSVTAIRHVFAKVKRDALQTPSCIRW